MAEVVQKTAEELQKEIEELQEWEEEIGERLRANRAAPLLRRPLPPGPRGQFGPPDGPWNGGPPAGRGRLLPMGLYQPPGARVAGVVRQRAEFEDTLPVERVDEDARPAKRLLSAVVTVGGAEAAEEAHRDDTEAGEQDGDVPRRHGGRGAEAPPPRVLPAPARDPALVTRNRRMFGALLGTLKKFTEEELRFQESETALKRNNSLQRAEERARGERDRLRQAERDAVQQKRIKDLELKAKVSAKAEEKATELLMLQWSSHQRALCAFLRTRCEPALLWRPAQLSEETATALEARAKDFEAWQVARRGELLEYQRAQREERLEAAARDGADGGGMARNQPPGMRGRGGVGRGGGGKRFGGPSGANRMGHGHKSEEGRVHPVPAGDFPKDLPRLMSRAQPINRGSQEAGGEEGEVGEGGHVDTQEGLEAKTRVLGDEDGNRDEPAVSGAGREGTDEERDAARAVLLGEAMED